MKRVTVIFSALMVCQTGLWASEAPPSFALAQLDYGAVIETAPEPGAAAPAAYSSLPVFTPGATLLPDGPASKRARHGEVLHASASACK